MNIATPLIPVAAAALEAVVQNVSHVVQASGAFARLLQGADSPGGRASQGSATATVGWGPEASEWGEMVRHDAQRQRFESLRRSVHDELARRFAEHGIDPSEPIVLTADSMGRVLEAGNHLDRAAIEELLQFDSALRSDVHELFELGNALWESGPTRTEQGERRLVVGEKELFFQVV